MKSETKLLVDLWDFFRDQIPAGKRQAAATHVLNLFEEYGVEVDLDDVEGECEYMDEAIELFREDQQEDSGYDEDEFNLD